MTEEKQFNEKDEKELKKHDEKTEENDLLSSLGMGFYPDLGRAGLSGFQPGLV